MNRARVASLGVDAGSRRREASLARLRSAAPHGREGWPRPDTVSVSIIKSFSPNRVFSGKVPIKTAVGVGIPMYGSDETKHLAKKEIAMTSNISMNRLGIEHLSVFGLPPVAFVSLAADLGCAHIATGLTAFPYNPHGYAAWSLREDSQLRREMKAVMQDRGVDISLGEGLTLRPGVDPRSYAVDLELMCELGVRRINTVAIDSDIERAYEQLAGLVAMAEAAGVETTLEFVPGLAIGNLAAALQAIRKIARPSFRLLIDTMHFFRSGSSVADLATVEPDLIGYIQLSDVPRVSKFANYTEEAMFERRSPGAGELPLLDLLAALPRDLVVGLEVPLRTQAEAGIQVHERLQPCVDAARRLLAEVQER